MTQINTSTDSQQIWMASRNSDDISSYKLSLFQRAKSPSWASSTKEKILMSYFELFFFEIWARMLDFLRLNHLYKNWTFDLLGFQNDAWYEFPFWQWQEQKFKLLDHGIICKFNNCHDIVLNKTWYVLRKCVLAKNVGKKCKLCNAP